eukprot:SAG31_NODE_945_length_10834_cov_16.777084_11_plen_74_part_00
MANQVAELEKQKASLQSELDAAVQSMEQLMAGSKKKQNDLLAQLEKLSAELKASAEAKQTIEQKLQVRPINPN